MITTITLLAFGVLVGHLLYRLFRDTLNRVQYLKLPKTYFYWLTRDNGGPGTPWVERKVFMKMTAFPWLQSDSGIKFRIPTGKTFQIGLAYRNDYKNEQEAMENILGAHELDLPVEQIRELSPSRLVKKES